MKVSAYITPRIVDNKIITLTCDFAGDGIRIMGSTIKASVISGGSFQHRVTLYPEEDVEGIVALILNRGMPNKGKLDTVLVPMILKLVWKENGGKKYPFIDVDDHWASADRIGEVIDNAIVVTLKNGERFSSVQNHGVEFPQGTVLPYYVANGDLLCRYLWGQANALDIIRCAVRCRVERNYPELTRRLTRDLEDMTRAYEAVRNDRNRLKSERNRAREHNRQIRATVDGMTRLCNDFKKIPVRLRTRNIRSFIEGVETVTSIPSE